MVGLNTTRVKLRGLRSTLGHSSMNPSSTMKFRTKPSPPQGAVAGPSLSNARDPSIEAWFFFVEALAVPYMIRDALSSMEIVLTKVAKDGALADEKKEASRSLRFSPNFAQNPKRGHNEFSKGTNKPDFGKKVGRLFRTLDLKAL